MAQILVIDDEPDILRFVSRALQSDGHSVLIAYEGSTGLQQAAASRPDLVILDLLLPGISGETVLKTLLALDATLRILVLSAVGDPHARVRCLEAGAVDFLVKPFVLAELLARVHSRLRDQPVPRGSEDDGRVAGRIRLDRHFRRADVGGHRVELSEREFLVLDHLMARAGRVCSRQELLNAVWGYDFDPGSNVVDVYIARLRAKLGDAEIETVRNVGYCIKTA